MISPPRVHDKSSKAYERYTVFLFETDVSAAIQPIGVKLDLSSGLQPAGLLRFW